MVLSGARHILRLQQCLYGNMFTCLSRRGKFICGSLYSSQTVNNYQTVNQVIGKLLNKVGFVEGHEDLFNQKDRSYLMSMLPDSQSELPVRSMQDSSDTAIIPLESDVTLREKYVNVTGGVRVGRLLEDLDIFAVWLCYKHLKNPKQMDGDPSPNSIVTALVDQIDFSSAQNLEAYKDIKISGCISWVGKSSIETNMIIEQKFNDNWELVTKAVFVLVSRDPLNQGSAFVNPLSQSTVEEIAAFRAGELNKIKRKMMQEESLNQVPPSETEKSLIHSLFLTMTEPKHFSFVSKASLPDNYVLMSNTVLKNLIVCFPENRNRFGKMFGGYIMRVAFELAWACAYRFSKQRPHILYIGNILFRKPVEIGSLLYMNAKVTYSINNHIHVSTKALVVDPVTFKESLSNIFHFTFEVPDNVKHILPETYYEAMLYLDGRRHYQMETGIQKFYGQRENKTDSA